MYFTKLLLRKTRELCESLIVSGQTVCFAESCTGGLLGALFTEIPGVSKVFLGSAVVYSNGAKSKLLVVSESTLEKYGAVSEQTCMEMAHGALSLYGSDFSLSITGIAGPGGGSPQKPVGLVWMGAVTRDGQSVAKQFIFSGSREDIRRQSLEEAINLTRELCCP